MTTTLEIARSAPSAAELGPVRPSERIAEIDILRGFALLGILLINLLYFDAPLSLRGSPAVELYPGRLDKAVRWIMDFFVAGKFNALILIPLRRRLRDPDGPGRGQGGAVRWDVPETPGHAARLRPVHAVFIWDGDILHLYAGIGLALILVRKLRDRWLWGIVVCCTLLPIGHWLVAMARGEKPPRTAEQRLERGLDELRIYGRGEYVLPRIDRDKATGALKRPCE